MKQKHCSKCNQTKGLEDFSVDLSRKDGLCPRCKNCVNERRRQSYWANLERSREQKRLVKRKLRATDPAGVLRKARCYREEHPGQFREYSRLWDKAHPAYVRERARRRRARKHGVNEHFTRMMEKFTRDFWNHECTLCGAETKLYIDHWLPLSRGHALDMGNAVLLCQSCNSRKHSRLPESFLERATVNRIQRMLKKQVTTWEHATRAAERLG